MVRPAVTRNRQQEGCLECARVPRARPVVLLSTVALP